MLIRSGRKPNRAFPPQPGCLVCRASVTTVCSYSKELRPVKVAEGSMDQNDGAFAFFFSPFSLRTGEQLLFQFFSLILMSYQVLRLLCLCILYLECGISIDFPLCWPPLFVLVYAGMRCPLHAVDSVSLINRSVFLYLSVCCECVHACMHAHVCHSTCVDVREKHSGGSSILPPCRASQA